MPLKSWIITARPGRDIDLVEDIGLVGRLNRHAEHVAEAGGEDEEPDQRPHQGGKEPLLLVDEAQQLALRDAGEADRVAGEPDARANRRARRSCRALRRLARQLPERRVEGRAPASRPSSAAGAARDDSPSCST